MRQLGWFSNAFNSVKDTVGNAANSVGNAISGAANSAFNTINSVAGAVGSTINHAYNEAGKVFERACDLAVDAAGDLVSAAGHVYKALNQFGNGLLNDIGRYGKIVAKEIHGAGCSMVKAVEDYVGGISWDDISNALESIARKSAGTLAGIVINVGGNFLVGTGCAALAATTVNPVVGGACQMAGSFLVGKLADLAKEEIDKSLNDGKVIDNVYSRIAMNGLSGINLNNLAANGIKILSKEGAKAVAKQAAKGVGQQALKEIASANFGAMLTARDLSRYLYEERHKIDRALFELDGKY